MENKFEVGTFFSFMHRGVYNIKCGVVIKETSLNYDLTRFHYKIIEGYIVDFVMDRHFDSGSVMFDACKIIEPAPAAQVLYSNIQLSKSENPEF